MRVCERASNIKYLEDKATILQHALEVPDCPATVMSKVALHGLQVPTWATIRELYAIPEQLRTVPSKEHFRVVAFVRVPGEVRGGKALSEGMFCVLCQRDPLCCQIVYDGTGQSFPMYNICCDKETVGAGMKSCVANKGKVLLYPIECLVPVTAGLTDSQKLERQLMQPGRMSAF